MRALAVTLIQGARGAGKSTLLREQLARGARRLASIVVHRPLDLATALTRLAQRGELDGVIAELGAGVDADVLSYVAGAQGPAGQALRGAVETTRVVSVIDGLCFLDGLTSDAEVDPAADAPREKLAFMLARHAESGEVLVVTKADLMAPGELRLLLAVLSELNPAATIAVAHHGRIEGPSLLARAPRAPALDASRRPSADVLAPAARERALVGVSTFTYRARRPFHPARLRANLLRSWPGVLRSRGIFWLATRMSDAGAWSQVGPVSQAARGGFWWSALEEQGWPIPTCIESAVRAEWREPFGDRRQQLTLIGLELDVRALQSAFDACLLTAAELELGPAGWRSLPDPFPAWGPPAPAPGAPAQGSPSV